MPQILMKNGRDSFLRGHETHPARPLATPLSITPAGSLTARPWKMDGKGRRSGFLFGPSSDGFLLPYIALDIQTPPEVRYLDPQKNMP